MGEEQQNHPCLSAACVSLLWYGNRPSDDYFWHRTRRWTFQPKIFSHTRLVFSNKNWGGNVKSRRVIVESRTTLASSSSLPPCFASSSSSAKARIDADADDPLLTFRNHRRALNPYSPNTHRHTHKRERGGGARG